MVPGTRQIFSTEKHRFRRNTKDFEKDRKKKTVHDAQSSETILIFYFLKKSGILMDCSFTLLVGVLGVSSEGVVPPIGRFSPLPLLVGTAPASDLGA